MNDRQEKSAGSEDRAASHIESMFAARPPLEMGRIIQSLPGCRALFADVYRAVIESVAPTLEVCQPSKFAQTAQTFADDAKRTALLGDYALTEYWGGRFIEEYLQRNPSHPQAALMVRHASDEKRHAQLFGELAGTSVAQLEGSAAFALEARFHQAYARWVDDDPFAMACLLHGFEVRSAVIQSHWFTLMALYPETRASSLLPVFSRIATDEVFHVTYTLQIVCRELATGADPSVLETALRLAEASIDVAEAMTSAQQLRQQAAHTTPLGPALTEQAP
jgi:hypothetical protein